MDMMESAATPSVAHCHAGTAKLKLGSIRNSMENALEGVSLSGCTSLTEFEEDQLRQLEEEILAASAAAATSSGGGAGSVAAARASAGARSAAAVLLRRGRRDRRWQQRILAVAAFKTEGQRRHLLEEDILSVAASVCSEVGSMASGHYSLDDPHQQLRRLTQNRSDGSGAGAPESSRSGGWSAPIRARNRGVFTAEDEDVMNLIVGLEPDATS
ncbi:hypothetical protein Vretimale_10638 [Volvox reticuliferus]|uniref:Uncharacterized protein n=1 Tax=Volvox reticuliferus TaxID=1737510 RepID=A0A8J4FTK1_9CHLO|nr:hypothetical protein Vretifemale_13943 [Volvox reticuliferus]GIM06316.1 hypothetical protein Vretimale_10638 [Volvox reticuliferus]